ncbi:MAG: prolyl oligopeptidase family serine peptidase [Alphaproteobacteria bacterium]|nr:prolyl oligopeptidase family serine peptidase [Alphaproteobacteria bacterium]
MQSLLRRLAYASALGIFSFNVPTLAAPLPPIPDTPAQSVVDRYHGVRVGDPYRWLENASDPAVSLWSDAQNKRTRAYLDALPMRAVLKQRLTDLITKTSPAYYGLHAAGGRIFAMYNQPPKQQPMIAVMGDDGDPSKARIVLDPNKLNPKGTTAVDWFVPSHDGKLIAVSLSEDGSENGSLNIFDVATGKRVGEVIDRVQYPTGGGSVAWAADDKSFYYTRYPGNERPEADRHFFQQVYFHTIGTDPSTDKYVLGKDLPKVAEIAFSNNDDPTTVLVTVLNGDGGEVGHYVIKSDGSVAQVTRFEDKVVYAVIGPDKALYMVSRKDAPNGKVLKLAPGDTSLADAKVIVPEANVAIDIDGRPLVATSKRLLVRYIDGGPSTVRVYDLEGKDAGKLALPAVAAVSGLEHVGDDVFYQVVTYLSPPQFFRYRDATEKSEPTKLKVTSPVNFADMEVVREFATSKDGTKVPLNIIRKKGTVLDGNSPVLLYGYGGYGVSETPYFLGATRRMLFDGGAIFVIANIRGGGEYGEKWHLEGNLTNKQNVFDDFIAAAEYLIAKKYTSPQRLAIMGGSNGGLLMGAALTQRPELFRAVVSAVGIYDMLRVELDPNGLFNTTEFGTVKDEAQFKALYAYSPYHHVTDGTAYPSILFMTGANDGRVNPMQSRKMTARLQSANPNGNPIFLRTSAESGHGIGSALSVRIAEYADYLSFLYDQLGMKLKK